MLSESSVEVAMLKCFQPRIDKTLHLFLHESWNILWAKDNITTEWVLYRNFQLRAQLDKLDELWQQHPDEELRLSLDLSFVQVIKMKWKVMKIS